MKFKYFMLLIASFPFHSHVHAQELFPGLEPRAFEFGQPINKADTIGGYPIWQNDGKWRLFHLDLSSSTGAASGIPLGRASWIHTEEGKFVAGMEVKANLRGWNASDWTDEPCKRDDFLYKKNLKGLYTNVSCVSINHRVNFFANPTGKYQEHLVKFREHKIEFPPTVIQVTVTRYSNNGRRYVVDLAVNPELDGFERAAESLWAANPWHKNQALKDPRKKAYIESLSSWADQFGERVEAAFEKKMDAFAGMNSWRSIRQEKVLPQSTSQRKVFD